MKATINDYGTKVMLEQQLKLGGLQWFELTPYEDVALQNCQCAVFRALISTDNNRVVDAWVITTISLAGFYNLDNYPTISDAVAQHIGRMAQEGKLILVEPPQQYEEQPEDAEPPQ